MFSGIVKGTGKVSKVTSKKDCVSIEIIPPNNFNTRLKKGASVSVDGVCLTSLDNGKTKLKFDVIDETLARTNLKLLKKNSLVNLERSITASTEIGGHLMSGHIHFTGKVKEIISKGGIVKAIPVSNTYTKPRSFFDGLNNWAISEGASGLAYITFEKVG